MKVLVTGAASGLGAALTERFTDRGDDVLATDVGMPSVTYESPSGTDAGMGGGNQLRLDVTSDEDWSAARDWVAGHWGGLDVLVNNAGVAGGGRVELCTLEEWSRLFETNLYGVVRGVRTFTPMLKAQGSGRIVNVASLAGLVHPPGMGSYNAVKAAVVAFSETLSHELAPYGVACSVVCPSYFRTNLVDSMTGSDPDVAAKVAEMVRSSPLTADDIAEAVLEGIDQRVELIIPDEPARTAYRLKHTVRPAYDAEMRRTAQRMQERTDG